MKNKAPKISVCIPTYNHAHFLEDATGSVLGQTFSDLELIIVDNCSTDNTRDIVEKYTALDSRIKYYWNEENIGAQNNFNRCLQYAAGEYVKILCADDLLEPTCLEKSADILDSHPLVTLVASARLLVTEDLQVIGTWAYSPKPELTDGVEVINKCLVYSNLIGEPSAVMFRKKHAQRGFDTRYKQLIDLEMWFHLLEQGSFAYIPETLCKFRQHKGQNTKAYLGSFTVIEDEFLLYNDYIHRPYIHLSSVSRLRVKYRTLVRIWNLSYDGVSFDILKSKVTAQYGSLLSSLVLYLKQMRNAVSTLFKRHDQ